MSRRSRLHVPGGVYYVVQRSNARQPIFTDAADYAIFERLLATMLARCRARVHAFCWEVDAIHLALQVTDMPVGRLMHLWLSLHGAAGRLSDSDHVVSFTFERITVMRPSKTFNSVIDSLA